MFSIQVFLLTLQKVAFLLVIIFIGFFMRRKGMLEREAATLLSRLTTHLFSPAYILSTLPQNFTVEKLGSNGLILLISLGCLLVAVFLGRFLAFRLGRSDFEKKSLCYAFTFANTGYFGYPVVQGVFGDEVLAQFLVFCIPFNIVLYSYGYGLFMDHKNGFSVKKVLFSPVMISYYAAILLGLSGIRLPAFLSDAASALGACMSPASMLSAGIVLGAAGLGGLLSLPRSYLYTAIRLVGLPVLFGIPLYFMQIRGIYLVLPIAALSMSIGLNTVVFPTSFGHDASENAKHCFVSVIFSIITLPVIFAVVTALAGI